MSEESSPSMRDHARPIGAGTDSSDELSQTPIDISRLTDFLPAMAPKWFDIGLELGCKDKAMELRESNEPLSRKCFVVIDEWMMEDKGDSVRWEYLCRVLRSEGVGLGHVADQIEQELGLVSSRQLSSQVDGSVGQTAIDISRLTDFLPAMAPKWFDIGLELGCKDKAMELRESNEPLQRKCFVVIDEWMMKDKGDSVLWEYLCRVLRSEGVGLGHVADQIEQELGLESSRQLSSQVDGSVGQTPIDISRLTDFLPAMAPKWFDIGLELGCKDKAMELRESNEPLQRKCFVVIDEWMMKDKGDSVPWEYLCRVLRSEGVGLGHVADQIEQKLDLESSRQLSSQVEGSVGFKVSLEAALAKGSVEVEIAKCVTLGPPEAGKTQLKSALIGRFDDSIESTPVSAKAEVAMQRYIHGKASWELLTRERLLNFLHTTVERKEFVKSTSATTSAKTYVSASSSVVVAETQPLPGSHQPMDGAIATDACGSEAEKKKDLRKQFSALKVSVKEGLKEADSAEVRSLQKVHMIHLIDSGGQPAFFDIHPVIATSRSVYLLVYNMEEGLDAKPKITYRKREFPTEELPNKKRSNMDLIKDSLLVLQNCKQKFAKMDEELRRHFGESISQSADVLPVLVVGTRKKVESIASESGKLAAGCGHLPAWSEMLDCTETGTKLFAVDSKDRDCEALQSVRDIINEAECTYRLKLPISWVLCQLIFWSADEDLHVLTYADLRDLCLHNDLVANNAEFEAMVGTFHLLGIFSFPYFDQKLTLGNDWKPDSEPVFTNPDVLYQQVTKILDVAFRHLEKTKKMNPEVKRSLKKLQSSGRLSAGTLSHLGIPDQIGSYTGIRAFLLEWLVHWGLAARLPGKVSTEGADGAAKLECFIPTVLPAYEQKSFQFPPGCPIPRLAFTFKVSLAEGRTFCHVPRGIFPHLVVNILSAGKHYHIQDKMGTYRCLFRDAVNFVIKPSPSGMEDPYSVVVTDDIDHISISIHPSHIEMKRSNRDCDQIIRDFRSAIEDAYERIYCTRHPATLTCPCPCDRIGKVHLSAILPHACNPAHYNQECLSTECTNWVRDCPEDIAAILNQGGSMAPVYDTPHIPSLHPTAPTPPPPPERTTSAVSLPVTPTRPADIIKALRHQVDARWRHFGTFLYFEPTLMDTIEEDRQGSANRMLDLVTKWVTHQEGTGDLPRTWKTVVEAVRDSGFGELAMELAEKHGVTLTQQ